MYLFAKKFGFDKEMFKNIKVEKNEPVVEDITREFNRACGRSATPASRRSA